MIAARVAPLALALGLAALPPGLVTRADAAETPPIEDNSFLVEEAYNQERRVVQHIGTWTHDADGRQWAFAFTQEWPASGRRHQLGYVLSLSRPDGSPGAAGLGDLGLNYRYQWLGMGDGRVAAAPRASLLVPTGDRDRGLGAGAAGLQVNLPVSVTLHRRWVAHTNVGGMWTGAAGSGPSRSPARRGANAGQSLIWLPAPEFNLLLELAWSRSEAVAAFAPDREESLLLAPGLRWAHDLRGGVQVVPGIAAPIGMGPSRGERALLLYLSVEHGF